MIKSITIRTGSTDETIFLGSVISSSISHGDGILFTGDLGAGKTTLIRGICGGLGINTGVKSPTFVLAWLYEGAIPVYHVDLYRLSSLDELENIGWEEMVDSQAVYLVEWADKFDLPYTERAMRIFMEYGPTPDERVVEVRFDDKYYSKLEKELNNYEYSGNRNLH